MLITVGYSSYLANQLEERERKNARLYVEALKTISQSANLEDEIVLESKIIKEFSLPTVYYQSDYDVYGGNNWGEEKDTSQVFLAKKYKSAVESGEEPIAASGTGEGYVIYTFRSRLYYFIRLFPIVLLVLLLLMGVFAYFLVDDARKSEQNRVWAGMAKETAHQLGTPISAMMAWLQILRDTNEDRADQIEIVDELSKDVERLELISDRFSKIGSDPELVSTNVYDQLSAIEGYMRRRAPRKVEFDFPQVHEALNINVNRHLFSWVLENLIRNALDAMDGQGTIKCEVKTDDPWIKIYLSDTGKGIPSGSHKQVFKPGFSTKKRGWGLGLSLAKRIIEEYHKGKIFVKQSKVNEGTTFAIYIPKS